MCLFKVVFELDPTLLLPHLLLFSPLLALPRQINQKGLLSFSAGPAVSPTALVRISLSLLESF